MDEEHTNPGSKSPHDALIDQARRQAAAARQSAFIDPGAIPGYEITREIHRGGQGVVFQAVQKSTKRKVAIKVIHSDPAHGSRGRTRFEREVELLGCLDHPHIVSVLDSGEADGRFFYVMDYVSGVPLDLFMKDQQPTIEDTLRIFATICDAVNAAHLRGIIHRDLKPGNILIDADAQPHVVDFGLAKVAIGETSEASNFQLLSVTGEFIGSLPWASPEQAGGRPESIDLRTDVYSLGVILYQMLTAGRFPYDVIGNMKDVLDNILRAQPVRPSTVRRQINSELETIVLMALAKERDRRYQSAGDLGRDIERYLAGRPIEAKRDSGWYLLSKAIDRHKPAVVVAAVFAITVLASAVVMSVLYARAEDARRDTIAQLERAERATAAEQAQRERAERHFDAVREMAHTFLFDFHESIRDTRGTTRSQGLIVTEALQYLRAIMNDTPDDPALLRELADAYDKVGDIQGGLSEQHLGDTAAAQASYAAAEEIRRALLERFPDDARAHADMAQSAVRLGAVMRTARRFDDSLRLLEDAGLAYDRAISRAEDPEAYKRDQALSYSELADTLVVGALDADDPDEARAALERAGRLYERAESFWAQRAAPDDEPARSAAIRAMGRRMMAGVTEARLFIGRADELRDQGDPAGADAQYDASLHRLSQATALGGRAASLADELAQNLPASSSAQRLRFQTLHDLGEAEMRVASVHERLASLDPTSAHDALALESNERALSIFTEALEQAELASRADDSNAGAQRDLAVALNKVGNLLLALGEGEKALRTYERSRETRERLVSTDPTPRARHDLALAHYKVGQTELRFADDAPDNQARRRHLEQSENAYRQSLSIYEALQSEGRLEPDSRYLRVVRGLLEETDAKLQSLLNE